MISKGTKLTVRPFAKYPNDPSKDQDISTGDDKHGTYQSFQAVDKNATQGEKASSGYTYIRAHTPLPLSVNDTVTVKEILGVQVKDRRGAGGRVTAKYVIVTCTIEETSPYEIGDDTDDKESEYMF